MNKLWVCSASMLLTAAGALPALAQTGDGLQLEEVVVTAQKREENLQQVSTSIQVKGGDELRKEGKKRIDEIMQGTVGIQAQDSQVGVTFYVRGIDSSGGMGAVVSAPILIDGVAQSRSESARGGSLDLAQAEIMRGPQSTTLGANSLAGAISLVSNKPAFEYQANGTLEVGNFDKLSMEGVLNVPLSDNQAIRLAYSSDKRDGYISAGAGDSDLTNARLRYRWQPSESLDLVATIAHQNIGGNGVQQGVLLSTGHWVPYTTGSYGLTFTQCAPGMAAGVIEVMGCPATFVAIEDGVNFRQRSNPWDDGYPADSWPNNPYRDTTIDQANLEINWSTAIGDVTFRPAIQKAHFRSQEPPRGTSWMEEDQKQDTTTLDLNINSTGDSRLTWQAGAYYSYDKTHDSIFKGINFPGAMGMDSMDPGDCSTSTVYCYTYDITPETLRKGFSVYGNAEFSLLDTLRLIAGARYNKDSASVVALGTVQGTVTEPDATQVATASVTRGSREWKKSTYRAGLEWDATANLMLYGVYSTGYTPGALDGMNPTGSEETTLEQISAGWKSQLLDGRLQFNGEFFHTTFHNRLVEGSINAYTANAAQSTCSAGMAVGVGVVVGQDTTTAGEYCAFVQQNAASAPELITKGLDMDLTWLITAEDRLTVTAEYLDTAYDSLPVVSSGGVATDLSAAGLQASALTQGDPPGSGSAAVVLSSGAAAALAASLQDTLQAFVGAQLQNAPKYSATLDYQHSFTFAGGSRLTPRIAATYKDKYWSFGGAPGAVLSDILADSSRIEWQQAYTKWDAYLTWENPDGKFTVTGYVRNLEDEVVMANYIGTYVSLEAPRTVGVTLNARF